MSSENVVKTTLRIDEDLMNDIVEIAREDGATVTAIVASALKYYRDYRYMRDKATLINEDIIKLIDSRMQLLEQRINTKTNQVLSSTAIEVEIIAQILAEQLEISPADVERFRRKAVDFIKMNNRVFRLNEIIE